MLKLFSLLLVSDARYIIDSDHEILSTSWKIRITYKTTNKKLKKRTVYQYDKMSQKQWELFTHEVETQVTDIVNNPEGTLNTEK